MLKIAVTANIMDRFSFLGAAHIALIDDLHEQYMRNPDALEPSWRAFFQGYDFARESYNGEENYVVDQNIVPNHVDKEFKVINLIEDYRKRGHLFTQTNPVRERRKYEPKLTLDNYGLAEEDLDVDFDSAKLIGLEKTTLRNIVDHLEKVYCSSIGVEFMYIRDVEEVRWLKERLSQNNNQPNFSKEQKTHILHKLNQAVAFENFLHRKFVGQKRFSLEGGETLIPALDALIEKGAELGVEEFVMGMAHRGRLNVLANIFGKTYEQIFSEFEGKDFEDQLFDGDVKYHLGYSTNRTTDNGRQVNINISPNPSHLEAVDPVVEGITRAKINNRHDAAEDKVCPILIHGDAAIAGQGVVYEVIQMAGLEGYGTGGTIHIVVNNQVGFTTNYLDGRTSTYCTDVAKVTLSPVFHVNADDAEAVVHCMQLAIEYRQRFNKDIFIDLLGYRKYGHNEGDEPRFTQPKLYKAIAKHPNPREIYNQKLIDEGVLGKEVLLEMENEFKTLLEGQYDESKKIEKNVITPFMEDEWKKYRFATEEDFDESIDTSFDIDRLREIAMRITEVPEDGKLYKKMTRLLQERRKMVQETNKIDWGMAELMAYGSLLTEEFNVRISGQDVERGTFSHRHAIMKMEDSEKEVCLLNEINENQGRFSAYNSLLSEYGVLGFDYGYSIASPETLTIWEAQFGDFSNGAQIMIDQFISSAEDKWKIKSGIVMLLPHGYEGQGAEHSSARMERYLQLCAENNMQMVNATTPANLFHMMRRQMKNEYRKPLVVFSPKSLLRHPKVVSGLEELATGRFHEVFDDKTESPEKIKKVVFCSGKVYYELEEKREELKANDVAIVRIEQLYPLPVNQIKGILAKYKNAERYIWAQEEPKNMGAWGFMLMNFPDVQLQLASIPESAAPATGSSQRAFARQNQMIDDVFSL